MPWRPLINSRKEEWERIEPCGIRAFKQNSFEQYLSITIDTKCNQFGDTSIMAYSLECLEDSYGNDLRSLAGIGQFHFSVR